MKQKLLEKYSLIIIGGGITGLSTGIVWALNNDINKKPVLIIEKEPKVGGMVTSFRRNGVLFDTAQMIPDSSDMLNYMGVKLELKKFESYYFRLFLIDQKKGSKNVINIPTPMSSFKKMLTERYPDENQNISRFIDDIQAMYNELFHLKVEPGFLDIIKILFKCPKIIKNKNKTFREFYSDYNFKNPELIEILEAFAAFSALPASKVSALMTVGAMNSTMQGSYRPKKGFVYFPITMEKRYKEIGGHILKKSEVHEFLIDNKAIKGIKLSTGEVIMADNLVTTIDPKVAMKELAGLTTIATFDKDYADKVEKMKMSVSAMTISLGLDDNINLKNLGFDCGYNILTSGNGTFEKLYDAFEKNELIQDENGFHCAVICPSLTTGDKPSISIRIVPVPLMNWIDLRNSDYEEYKIQKENISQFYIDLVEKYMIPGLSKHIIVKDIATPATFARYSGSPTGSNYDMAPFPDNFGRNRLKMRTPITNLYQPKFSHGIWPCLQSGFQVVDMIMEGKINNGYSRFNPKK